MICCSEDETHMFNSIPFGSIHSTTKLRDMQSSKKEICSYFLRGSCRFGDRCKNPHVPLSQQQPKANGFSFGTQDGAQKQQQQNPFGFGVKTNSQPRGSTDFGSKNNQHKPFENKWSRFSPLTNAAAAASPSSRQSDSQPATDHECTDAKSCQSIIAEDVKERPLWKLTCYAHYKNRPCDISGDVSYEELRAAAYKDAKRGLSVESIVDRERRLISSKLAEFDNLTRNPLPAAAPNAFSLAASNANPPVVSSFSQGALLTASSGARSSEPSGAFIGNSSSFVNQASAFGPNSMQSASTGLNSFQFSTQMQGSSPTSFIPSVNSNNSFGPRSNTFSAPPFSPQLPSTTSHQPTSGLGQTAEKILTFVHSNSNTSQSNDSSRDTSIWMKEEWLPGEIPEEAPPNELIF